VTICSRPIDIHQRPPDTPGPGHYGAVADEGQASLMFQRSANAVFGTGSARGPRDRGAPGPGAYIQDSTAFPRGPSYSLTERLPAPEGMTKETRLSKDGPGPGAYGDVGSSGLAGGPKFSMGTPRRGPVPLQAAPEPGPGHYQRDVNPDAVAFPWQRRKNGYVFGTAVRVLSQGSRRSPGPGQYPVARSTLGGPSITMSPRFGESRRREDGPGPGAHNDPHTIGY